MSEEMPENVAKAIDIAVKFGQYDGDHHKTWVIDQMIRVLAGNKYEAVIPSDWDNGSPP